MDVADRLYLQLGVVDDQVMVIQESPTFEEGEGFRVALTPHQLLIQIRNGHHESTVLSIPVITLLMAISEQTKRVGS